MERAIQTVQTEYGPVRIKTGNGFGASKSKAEYEDLARLAIEKGLSIFEMKAGQNRTVFHK